MQIPESTLTLEFPPIFPKVHRHTLIKHHSFVNDNRLPDNRLPEKQGEESGWVSSPINIHGMLPSESKDNS